MEGWKVKEKVGKGRLESKRKGWKEKGEVGKKGKVGMGMGA